jgi:hypothetical protein
MRARNLFAAVAVAGGLAFAGCGGDDDESTTTSEGASGASGVLGAAALTEDEFATQGNEICSAGDKDLDAAGQALGENPSQDDLDAYVTDTLVPGIQAQIDAIRALPAPEATSSDVETFLDDAQEQLDQLESDPSLVSDQDLFADVNAQATELGLTECAG